MTNERHALRWQPLWLATGWLLVAIVIYASLAPAPPDLDLPQGDKLGHVLAYAVLMYWFAQIYYRGGSRASVAAALAAMGVALEFLQGHGGYRAFELQDMAANVTGVVLGWSLAPPRTANLLLRIEKRVVT